MFESYISELIATLQAIPAEDIDELASMVRAARESKHTVWVMGNGGSASVAEHFASDLFRHGARSVCLTSNPAIITSISNDFSYDESFSRQLANAMPGDLVIAISTSGNSKNIIRAIKSLGKLVTTVGITNADGGELYKLVRKNIFVTSTTQDLVEDVFSIIAHLVCRGL